MKYNKQKLENYNNEKPVSWAFLFKLFGFLALAAASFFSAAANAAMPAIKTHLGMDYRATGFMVHSKSFSVGNGADTDNGFAQYLRLEADFLNPGTGVSVHTRIQVSGSRWRGDTQGPAYYYHPVTPNNNAGEIVRVDLAYVQIPIGNTLLRVGRQEANWNHCFLVCDDRRDRVLVLHKFGHLTAVGVYDRRADTAGFNNVDNGDMVAGGIVTPLMNKNWILGLLWVHWFNHYNGPDISGVTYPLSRVDIFSPYLDGKIGPVTFKTGFNDFADGSVTTPARDQIFSGNMFGSSGWSEYFRVGTTMGKLTAQAQFVGVENGGLISPGFDTFSSMINSSPESTTNPTSVYNMGNPGPQNLGLMGSKQYLYIGRLTYKATDKVSLRGSVGVLDVKSPTTTGGVISDSSMVYDAQASYQINKIVRTWVTLGWLGANKAALLQGNSLIGTFPNAETGTNNPYAGEASFAHHGVFAASLNLGVKF